MEIYVIFGLPGAGKTYVGKIFQRYFNFFHYDGDLNMSQKLKDAIVKEAVTDEMRDEFFNKLITNVRDLKTKYDKIVISQTFIKEKYREKFLDKIPETKFILIETNSSIRENRIMSRDEFKLKIEQWRRIAALFETPSLEHTIIYNDQNGEENVKKQLLVILN